MCNQYNGILSPSSTIAPHKIKVYEVSPSHALMGVSASGGGRRATRALRLLLLLVLALAAVEFLFGSILDASPLRTYLYTPTFNATQSTIRFGEKSSWPKQYTPAINQNITKSVKESPLESKNATFNQTIAPSTYNISINAIEATRLNITANATEATRLNITANATESPPDYSTNLFLSQLFKSIKGVTLPEGPVTKMPLCEIPTDLGPIEVNKTDMELDMVEKKFPEVHWGGRYYPPNCTARHKVAIIVPYRDRQQHLAIFLNHMHPFLMKQQIEYGIFIVEQEGNKAFNRAKLMNVGFVEAQRLKAGGWQCFIFHDIDLLPLDTRNMYSCPRQPRHMSASIDKWNFVLPYEDLFGGVSAVSLEQFVKVNGFSNKYWGWGGEDDDMAYRLKKMKYHVARYKMSIARYAMLDHKRSVPNPKRYQLLSQTSKTFQKDGISTLQYELVQVMQYHLYTHIIANIDDRS